MEDKEPTLHELNMQQRRIDEARREQAIRAGKIAIDAVKNAFGVHGKRRQKNLRAPPPVNTQGAG